MSDEKNLNTPRASETDPPDYSCALTTMDNPYDPFEQFDEWFAFDVENEYYSCAYLARIAQITDDMSDEEVADETERAIDEIIENDFRNIYKKVKIKK